MCSPMIVASDLVKEYDGMPALGPLSFTLKPRRCLALLGPNGAGKSSLLRMIALLSLPTSGTLSLAGTPHSLADTQMRQRLAYISHDPMVYQELTAVENLKLTARLYGVACTDDTLYELLDSVGLLHRAHDMPATFSRGMTQRLSIARALVTNPSLILFDEPFSGLDLSAREWLTSQMQRLAANATMVVVTHQLHEVEQVMTDALILHQGKAMLHSVDARADQDRIAHCYHELMGEAR